MTSQHRLTDRPALCRYRERAKSGFADFLLRACAAEIHERLSEVNKSFTDVSIVSGFPGFWNAEFPDATIVEDAETLALEPHSRDLILHSLALHWANDPVGQLIQCQRALRPDGLFIAMLFGGRTLGELRTALAEAEVEITGGLSPRVAPMGEIRDLGALLQRAGFALPVADTLPFTVSYPDLPALMKDLRAMGECNAMTDRLRHFSRRDLFTRAGEIYRNSYGLDDGRIPATFEIITLTGWCPAPDQQKPLRPGSAKTRLADALGTKENKIPDIPKPKRN